MSPALPREMILMLQRVALAVLCVLLPASAAAQQGVAPEPALESIPDSEHLAAKDLPHLAVFVVTGDALTQKHVREAGAGELGLAAWRRLTTLIPAEHREGIVQFNVIPGRRWAGRFGGDGKNDAGRTGYQFSIAAYVAEEESELARADRPVTPRRGTLDWTIVHEMGHYICLKTDAIERFSRQFDAKPNMPVRREQPDDYPDDGSPVLNGGFVTSYAERTPGDEEVVETFTTYLTVPELPTNDSWAARKIRFFATIPGMPELRAHVQAVGHAG